jgi:energy-coupling factor transporter ATP-binding protein EcfA2
MATDPTQMPSPPAPPLAESGIRLAAIRVQDFRSLRDVTMRLQPGITVLVGENNSGKTSMLEALAVAMGSRRPRLEDLYQDPSGRVASCQLDIRMEPTSGEEFSDDVRGIVGDAMRVPLGPDAPEYFVIRTECKLAADGLDVEVWR